MNKKSGVTLVALVVTIIVMALIATIIVVQTDETNEETSVLEFVNQMKQIEVAVENERYKKEENTSYTYKGTLISTPVTVGTQTYPSVTNTGNWYNVTQNELESIGIKLIPGDYIINYDTLKVISVSGIKYKDIMYYTLYDILQVVNLE